MPKADGASAYQKLRFSRNQDKNLEYYKTEVDKEKEKAEAAQRKANSITNKSHYEDYRKFI